MAAMTVARTCALVGLCAVTLLVGGCHAPPVPPVVPTKAPAPLASVHEDCASNFGAAASLQLDKGRLRANGALPRLIAKLDASAHRYSRLLAAEMSSRVCLEFRDLRWHLPAVAVHGDAHFEQFVVTPTTFGLEDYDQAGFGPAVVDLVRFASSIHLLCREVKWACDSESAVSSFFKAYRASLDRAPTRELPAVVARVRKRVPQGPLAWLAWTDSLTQPLEPQVEQKVKQHWSAFIDHLDDATPARRREFYDIVRLGNLQMGIGSALEAKRLFRVRGESSSPADDVILEARSTSQPVVNGCVWRPSHGGSLHTLMFMSLLGPRMPQVFGTVVLDEAPGAPEYWMQSWDPGYYELELSDLESQMDVEQLAVDAARQLAGHFWTRFPEPLRVHQRNAQLRAFDLSGLRARALAKSLADETSAGWERFRSTK